MFDLRPVEHRDISSAVIGAYSSVVSKIGSLEFAGAIGRAIDNVVPVDRFYVFDQAALERPPGALYAWRYESWLSERLPECIERFFRNDPLNEAIRASEACASAFLLRVGPDDIADPAYREWFFLRANVVQRVSLVMRLTEGCFILNASRSASRGELQSRELESFVAFGQLLLPLVAQHRKLTGATPESKSDEIQELEDRFAREFSQLTERERQVCARTVIGMTAKQSAQDLGIAETSVITYRKRAYQRLGVANARQLARKLMLRNS